MRTYCAPAEVLTGGGRCWVGARVVVAVLIEGPPGWCCEGKAAIRLAHGRSQTRNEAANQGQAWRNCCHEERWR